MQRDEYEALTASLAGEVGAPFEAAYIASLDLDSMHPFGRLQWCLLARQMIAIRRQQMPFFETATDA